MKILMVSWEYPPVVIGGLGRHVHHLATELVAAGHDVVVLSRRPTGTDPATHPTTDEVSEELDRITTTPPLYGPVRNALWSSIACVGFSFLNNGGPIEMACVFVGAGLGQLLRRAMLHRGYNQFGVTMLAAAVACVAYLSLVQGLHSLGATNALHQAGYVSAVLFLIPGFALVTGALDLAKLDFSAGVARLTHALMLLTSAALALWGVSAIVGLSPEPGKRMAMSVGALGAVSAGYDKKAAAKSYRLPAEGLANFAKSLPALFDARAAGIAGTGASPAIWSDDAGFAARTAQYRDATGALLAAIDAGDDAGIPAALASTKAACKACHDTYRTQ